MCACDPTIKGPFCGRGDCRPPPPAPIPQHEDTPTDAQLAETGWAPGSYSSICCRCNTLVHGVQKRSITCRPCASTAWRAALHADMQWYAQVVRTARIAQPRPWDALAESQKQAVRTERLREMHYLQGFLAILIRPGAV